MARSSGLDFFHSFRFAVVVRGFGPSATPQLDTLDTQGNVTAGFNSCSIPELTQEAVEYREGHYQYTQKYVGLPSISDVTLGRGVARRQGTLWKWVQDTCEAGNEYRADMDIYHIHRDAKPQTASSSPLQINTANTNMIKYECHEAIPTGFKPANDLDATSSDVSIAEVTVSIESFNVVDQSV